MMTSQPSSAAHEASIFGDFTSRPVPAYRPGTQPLEVVRCAGTGEHITWFLDFSFEAASAARRAIRPYLMKWDVDTDTVDTAYLLVSELVANAVEHGEPPVFLHLARGKDTVTIAVQDAGGELSRFKSDSADPGAESGRGLHLVDALCHRSQLTGTPHGTLAVAEIST